jgi:CHAD domain-containing protein
MGGYDERAMASFEINPELPAGEAIRALAADRLGQAIKALTGKSATIPDGAVHNARKRLKELRAVLRLVRGELPQKAFARENAAFRDAARPLSELRDAAVLIETVDELLTHFAPDVNRKPFAPLRRALSERRRVAHADAVKSRVLGPVLASLKLAQKRVARWPLPHEGFAALSPGLVRTYRQGRSAMAEALASKRADDEAFHEWRKRAKDLRYHLELLTPLNSEALKPLATQAKDLTDFLGVDHDLAVLQGLLDDELSDVLEKTERHTLEALLGERRRELQKNSRELGALIYAEKPAAFIARIESYWRVTATA